MAKKSQYEKSNDEVALNLNDCDGCEGCKNCNQCTDCVNCTNCVGCTDCNDCEDCTGCFNCSGCVNVHGQCNLENESNIRPGRALSDGKLSGYDVEHPIEVLHGSKRMSYEDHLAFVEERRVEEEAAEEVEA